MANPKILYTDLSLLNFAPGLTDAAYPATNLNNYILSSTWKSSATTENQVVDFTSSLSQSCNTLVIDNHNLGSLGNNYVGIGFYTSSNGVNWNGVGDIVLSGGYITPSTILYEFPAVNSRFWRIYITGGNPFDVKPSIGNIFLGSALEFTTPYDGGFKIENTEYKTTEFVTLSGTTRTSQQYKGRIVYELKFSLQTDALRTAFQTFIRSVRGRMYPFYFIDTDGTTIRYMNLESDYVPVVASNATGRYGIESLIMKTNESTY